MNRQIKFRAWDTRGKSWLIPYPKGFYLFGETTCFDLIGQQMHERYPGESSLLLVNDVEVTQYTGLKDKNGIEVYEGDIVQPYTSGYKVELCQIKYLERSFCMAARRDKEKMDCIWYYDFEVIGNVYENPELLK